MSRPKRIQYEGACYHVSNQAKGDRPIASSDEHRKMFVSLLGEIHKQFEAEIHAWCLTDDCYHLLLSTPLANLSKVMRHLNSVYTQKLNRHEHTKGAVFNGRYKSILIDPMLYLIHVGKKIHKTPQEMQLVEELSEYIWSSYRSYIGLSDAPDWLCHKSTHDLLQDYDGKYNDFMQGDDDEYVSNFYSKKRLSAVMGNKEFRQKIKKLYAVEPPKKNSNNVTEITSKRICRVIANVFKIDLKEVYASRRGDTNMARLMAIYLHHVLAQYEQSKIAELFKFKQSGSVGSSIYRYKKIRNSFPEITEVENVIVQQLKQSLT